MKPTFFKTPAAFRAWLEKHHNTASELWVGYYRKESGRATITWQESVDEALCFGWIDGIRKKIDETAYTNRFTPRRPGSNWSAINIDKIALLTKQKRMHPAGLAAFKLRTGARSRVYNYEQKEIDLRFEPALERQFKNNKKAWAFFQTLPPYYRRGEIRWVNTARQTETKQRRLDKVMAACESGRRR